MIGFWHPFYPQHHEIGFDFIADQVILVVLKNGKIEIIEARLENLAYFFQKVQFGTARSGFSTYHHLAASAVPVLPLQGVQQ